MLAGITYLVRAKLTYLLSCIKAFFACPKIELLALWIVLIGSV
jgi:hypothetical protein